MSRRYYPIQDRIHNNSIEFGLLCYYYSRRCKVTLGKYTDYYIHPDYAWFGRKTLKYLGSKQCHERMKYLAENGIVYMDGTILMRGEEAIEYYKPKNMYDFMFKRGVIIRKCL